MSSEVSRSVGSLVVLLAGGALLHGLRATPADAPVRSTPLERLFALTGSGAELVADGCWLGANLAWERREEASVRRWITAATAAAPENPYFRVNAARMIAFDFPAWRAAGERAAPEAVREKWRRTGGEEALNLLDAGAASDARLALESANIVLYALRDRERAANLYRNAAELPGAPWHAVRIHAQLLRELGREREALEWLRSWLPRLPPEDPAAQRELVAQRIAELELELRARGEPL